MPYISKLQFIKKQKTKPFYESSAITGLVPKLHFKLEKKEINIISVRNKNNGKLDINGYELHKTKTKYDEYSIINNLNSYKEELIEFLKKRFNYQYIFIFDLTIRSNRKKGAYNFDGRRLPADRAHVDYTLKSGPYRAKEIIGPELFKETTQLKKRIIQLNAWRPLCNEVKSSPLTFADPSTIEPSDLIATDQIFPKRIGEIYHIAYNKKQKWYWVPNMKKDEILLLKGWDSSNSDKIIKFTPHTSFNLKSQNIKKNPRTSIEARIFLIL